MRNIQKIAIFLAMALMINPDPLFAYVGPGPGLNFITSLIGLIGAILTSIFFIVIWAFKSIFKKNKKKDSKK